MYFSATESGSGSVMDDLNVTCSPDFFLENSTCFPLCQEWKQFSDGRDTIFFGIIATTSVLAVLGGIAMIVGSVIRYKSM